MTAEDSIAAVVRASLRQDGMEGDVRVVHSLRDDEYRVVVRVAVECEARIEGQELARCADAGSAVDVVARVTENVLASGLRERMRALLRYPNEREVRDLYAALRECARFADAAVMPPSLRELVASALLRAGGGSGP